MYIDISTIFYSNIPNLINSNIIVIFHVYYDLIWIKVLIINIVIKMISSIQYIFLILPIYKSNKFLFEY